MSTREEIRIHHAQSLLNGQDAIREAVRAGTYNGRQPIADEDQLDQMISDAENDVAAAGLAWGWPDEEIREDYSSKRGGLLGWIFG